MTRRNYQDYSSIRPPFGAACRAVVMDAFAIGTEVDVARTNGNGVVVADRALEEREPKTGIGVKTRDEGGEGFARSGPVRALHAAAAVQQTVDIGDVSRIRGRRGTHRQTNLEQTAAFFIKPCADDGSNGRFFVPSEDEIAVGQMTVGGKGRHQVFAIAFHDDGMAGRGGVIGQIPCPVEADGGMEGRGVGMIGLCGDRFASINILCA